MKLGIQILLNFRNPVDVVVINTALDHLQFLFFIGTGILFDDRTVFGFGHFLFFIMITAAEHHQKTHCGQHCFFQVRSPAFPLILAQQKES